MHKLIIHKLGPIEHAEIDCNRFMVFTGSQASGKSTIAKALFFFRTIKDDIFDLILRQASGQNGDGTKGLLYTLDVLLRIRFCELFGQLPNINRDMRIEYVYSKSMSIKLIMRTDYVDTFTYLGGLVSILSEELKDELSKFDSYFISNSSSMSEEDKLALKNNLSAVFSDDLNIVFIPAGRSLTTLMGNQLTYIYTIMDDVQKSKIDYCTRKYLQTVIKLGPEFSEGLTGLEIRYIPDDSSINDLNTYSEAKAKYKSILKSSYQYNHGREILLIDTNPYTIVDINYASSGQQESVWILNLLFYYLLQKKPVFFIIEEPESHLFPEAQKAITELIALVHNSGHQMLITTHSPYVLGSLNNLIYASELASKDQSAVEKVISKNLWIPKDAISAWYVEGGKPEDCIDAETGFIQNELIDEISGVINDTFDKLLDIQTESEQAGE